MFKYAKTTKLCFTHENSKNKKLDIGGLNKSKLKNKKKDNNKISFKNIQKKKDTTNSLAKPIRPIRNSVLQLKNNNGNNRKKINDYFNNPSYIRNESNFNILKENFQLEIPDSLKKFNTIYPPVNYNYIKKIDLKKQTKNEFELERSDDVKIELKKRMFSNVKLKKHLILIYNDIMLDEYENNQEDFTKTSDTIIKIKINHDIKKKFHDNFVKEINNCYNDCITPECNRNYNIFPLSDQDNDEDICQFKKSKKETKEINKILIDIYNLNINEAINQISPNFNEDLNNKSSQINNSSKTINKSKKAIQQTIFSTFHSSVKSTYKTRKRRFSNSNNVRKTNVKQTKLTFTKRQKTI